MSCPKPWLIGKKDRTIEGTVSGPNQPLDRCQKLATRRSGYIAPLGAPVLPEV